MSSSAFFIEAAANTVRLLSCATAGEAADPNRRVKHKKIPARRCIGSAPGVFTALCARANQALVGSGCDRRKRRSGNPFGLTVHRDIARQNNNRMRGLVKGSSALFGRQDRNRHRILLGSADLQHERAGADLVLHGLADAIAIGGAAAFGLRKCPSCTTSTQPPADRLMV